VAELLALLAAAPFALGRTLQQRGALETAADSEDPRFLVQMLGRPAWLFGGLFQAVGWILQASSNSTTLIASVIIGSLVFGETISQGGGLPLAILGLVMAVAAIWALVVPPPVTESDHPGSPGHLLYPSGGPPDE